MFLTLKSNFNLLDSIAMSLYKFIHVYHIKINFKFVQLRSL